ncbi:reverse transcriptase domain-containing protein [Tanacetum coccineum]
MADNQPMWGNNRAVAPTPRAAIVAVDLEDNFTIKGNTNADAIKIKIFPPSLAGDAKVWFNELSSGVITTWEEMRQAFDLLCSCHGHSLGRGTIIQIFYHGLDEAIQAILDAGGIFLYKTPNEAHWLLEDRLLLKLDWSKYIKAKPLQKTVAFAEVVEDHTHRRSVMTNPWEDLRVKKQTMLMEVIEEEDIEETTTVGVPETSVTVNQEMTTKIPNLEKTTLPFHQHPKRNSMNPTLKKPCENLWSLKNRRMTLSKISSSTSKPKLSKDKRITKLRFKTLKQSLVDSPANVPLDQLSGKTYDPPVNPNAKTTIIHDDSEDEADEAEKEDQRTLVDVLAVMPNYGEFLKDLVSNKSKMKQISTAFLNEEYFSIVQNKLPHKLGDPGSFLIPCTLAGSVEYLALADLGASINLMPYSLYVSLFENSLKLTRMSVHLANHTYKYPMGVAENMLVQVGKFIFLIDFVILQMEEDDKVPLILERPFLHIVDAII